MTRKKHAKKKRKEKKRKRIKEKSGQKCLLEKVQKSLNIPKERIITTPNDVDKMSDVIQDFAKPLLLLKDDEEFQRKALRVAILVWNISLFPKQKQEKALQEICSDFSKPDDPNYIESIKTIVNALIERKRKNYPNHKKVITDFQISGSGKSRRLNVVSTPYPW